MRNNWEGLHVNASYLQQQAAYSTPPLSVVTANQLFGIPLNDIVLYATLLYVLIQIAVALPKLVEVLSGLFKGKTDD